MDSKKNSGGIFPLLERMGMVTKREDAEAESAAAAQPRQAAPQQPGPMAGYAAAPVQQDAQPGAEALADDPIRRLLEERERQAQSFAVNIPEEELETPVIRPQQQYAPPAPPKSMPMSSPMPSAPSPIPDYMGSQDQSPKDYNTAQAAIDLDRFMEVEELYKAFSFQLGGTDTVFIIEEYMKTLPDTLPVELKKQIILKIIDASNFNFENLIKDGKNRITELNNYAFDFSKRTDSIVAQCNSEIAKLEEYIANLKNVIGERQNLHKKQFLSIENEVQRLKRTIDTVTK